MAESTFSPGAPVGYVSDRASQGFDEGQSMMERAQRRKANEQMIQMRDQQLQQARILAPVIEAKAKADLISAGASIANNTRMEQLRQQAAAVSKPANDEFLDAMQLADWNSKASALAGLQAKYQWMSLIPEYKGFIDTVNDERVKSHLGGVADMRMEQQLEEEQMRLERATTVAEIGGDTRLGVARIGADSRLAATDMTTGSRERVAAATNDSREQVAQATNDNRIQGQKYSAAQRSAIQADKDAAKAAEGGDEANAAIYRKHASEFREAAKREVAPVEKTSFDVPNVTPAPSSGPKLYNPPAAEGQVPSFSPAVKNPTDVIKAMQQMVDDGVVTSDQARETLKKLGFKSKG